MSLLEDTVSRIGYADNGARKEATERILEMTMPNWALGRLLDLAVDLAGMTGIARFSVKRKQLLLFAGDHGIVAEHICPQPSCVTTQMVRNFASGGGSVSVLARNANVAVELIDVGVAADLSDLKNVVNRKIAFGTRNFAKEDAMTRTEAVRALEVGIESVERHPEAEVFAIGEMGIGNTTPASAIAAVFCDMQGNVTPLVGRGAGLAQERLAHKCQVISDALQARQADSQDPVGVLAKIGGFEIGGMAGAILGCAARRKVMVVDGFIASAAALLAQAISPRSAAFMIAAHGGAEPGHRAMLEKLQKKPLLDLGLRLGEGTGALLAMPLLDAAGAMMREMTTFSQANVTTEGLK